MFNCRDDVGICVLVVELCGAGSATGAARVEVRRRARVRSVDAIFLLFFWSRKW